MRALLAERKRSWILGAPPFTHPEQEQVKTTKYAEDFGIPQGRRQHIDFIAFSIHTTSVSGHIRHKKRSTTGHPLGRFDGRTSLD
jgi:hypothetical protein